MNNGLRDNQSSTQSVIGSWVSKIKSWFTSKLDIGSPSKVFEDFGAFTIEGFNEGIKNNMGSSFNLVRQWSDGIINGFSVDVPQLDYSVPDVDFTPKIKATDMSKFQNTMQMEMDAKMAELAFEERQRNERLDAIIAAIENKQLIVGDDAIFQANRRATKHFGDRTRRDPYPIYGTT